MGGKRAPGNAMAYADNRAAHRNSWIAMNGLRSGELRRLAGWEKQGHDELAEGMHGRHKFKWLTIRHDP